MDLNFRTLRGDQSPALSRALNYLRSHPDKTANNYQKALAANAFLANNRSDAFGRELLNQLKTAATTGDKDIHWSSQGRSLTYSHGSQMDVETTALCTMGMIKAGLWPESVKQSLTWLSKQKARNGTWGTTQATILAMRALIMGSSASLGQDFESNIAVWINGEKAEEFRINKDNSDVMKQINLTRNLRTGNNRLELRQSPAGELPFQVSAVHWTSRRLNIPTAKPTEDLQIDIRYDRTTLAVNDLLKCSASVRNNTGHLLNMAIVDLGIPPGFELDATVFGMMQQNGQIEKFEATENQVILYLRRLSESAPFSFDYSLRAKYPLRVQTPASTVYEYYQPKNRAESHTQELEVREHGL